MNDVCRACGQPLPASSTSCPRCGMPHQDQDGISQMVNPSRLGQESAGPPASTFGDVAHPSTILPPQPLGGATRTAVAHLVLWVGVIGGSALLTNSWFHVRSYDTLSVPLTSFLEQRTAVGVIVGGPFMAAALIVGRDRFTRAIGVTVGLAAGALTAAAAWSYGNYSWLVAVCVDLLLLTGWLAVRRVRRLSYLWLICAAVFSVVWEIGGGPGLWLRLLAFRSGIHQPVLLSFWAEAVFVVLALIGLLAVVTDRAGGVASNRQSIRWPTPVVVMAVLTLIGAIVTGSTELPIFQPAAAPASFGAPPTSSRPSADAARAIATQYFEAARAGGNGAYPACIDQVRVPSIDSYQIDQVSPATTGAFDVSATVVYADGSTGRVTVTIGTSPSSGNACVQWVPATLGGGQSNPGVRAPTVPSSADPVPTGASVAPLPAGSLAIPFTNTSQTPSNASELVVTQPSSVDADQQAAIGTLIRFLTYINQQDFQSAWDVSTNSTKSAVPNSSFVAGYLTTRQYQVSFGQPQTLTPTLIAVPASFISRQDPAAQGNPSGVTDCTYWPQYVFLVANVNGQWLDDVGAYFNDDPSVIPLKRADTTRANKPYLDPLSQRVPC